jgi:reactive intermediate/imine deaminase
MAGTLLRLLCIAIPLSAGVGARAAVAAEPADADASHVSSTAIDAGDYVYISGQGPRHSNRGLPSSFAEQCRQAFDNVRRAVEAVGLSTAHVVYMQVYLEDMGQYPEMNEIFVNYFAEPRPARAVLGVAKLPEPAIEISAVAVRDLTGRRAIYPSKDQKDDPSSPGILTGDRLFVSGMPGIDRNGKVPADAAAQVDLALDRLKAVVEAAGLDLRHMVFVNPYLIAQIAIPIMNERYARRFEFGNTPARATIEVTSLPGGAHIEFTGVAVRDLQQRRAVRPKNMPPSPTASPCVFARDTLYCSAKSGFIPGLHGGVYAATTPHQLRQTMRNLLDNLEEASVSFDQVVATNVYLDDVRELPAFDEVYGQYFSRPFPARTVIQQIAPAGRKPDKEDHYPDLEQVSLIAVRGQSHR